MTWKQELESQLAAAEQRIVEMTAAVQRNDDKLRRSQQRELRLLQSHDLGALFRELIDGLRASYGLQYVSVVLSDPDYDICHLMMANGTPAESFPNLLMVESVAGLAPQYIALHAPWLGKFAACDHALICPRAEAVQSIAMIPLANRGQLIGSINLCSDDPERFTSRHASDFLAHLGVIASFCIENAVNRARLLRSGFTDVLTGWHNRRYLLVRLAEELARARRDGHGIACLMLDADHFKSINDQWGHAAGDAVLRELAQRIEAQIRASDVAARYGGEEFIILLPETDIAAAEHLAERVREAASEAPYPLPDGDEVPVTVSIGLADVKPGPADDDLKATGEALLARADTALYESKSAGRDRVTVAAA